MMLEPQSRLHRVVGSFCIGCVMKNEKKKKLNKLDLYVIFSLAVLVIYTISALVVFVLVGVESKILTICVYGAFSGEVVQCYFIRKGKLQEEIKLLEKRKELGFDDDMGVE